MFEQVDGHEFYVAHVSESEAKGKLGDEFMLPIPMLLRVCRRAEVSLQEVTLAHVLWFYDQTVMVTKGN